jgi:hypothetical protein
VEASPRDLNVLPEFRDEQGELLVVMVLVVLDGKGVGRK